MAWTALSKLQVWTTPLMAVVGRAATTCGATDRTGTQVLPAT
ncbi:hypothetical protein [Saccharopolyspora sp. ASAGF58]|nr:hypothetical protein [Saccharopolyspora sp. ASAGF58]